jgi:hypothetical protein
MLSSVVVNTAVRQSRSLVSANPNQPKIRLNASPLLQSNFVPMCGPMLFRLETAQLDAAWAFAAQRCNREALGVL